MHELSVAQSLLDIVLSEAQRHGADKIVRVGVTVGAFTSVVPHALKFSFDLIKENTPAAEAELVITQVPLAGVCEECDQEVMLESPEFLCPNCGSPKVLHTQGRELQVDYIETPEPEGEDAPPAKES